MLTNESVIELTSQRNNYIVDGYLKNDYLKISKNETKMEKKINKISASVVNKQSVVNKTYEMNKGIISESFLDISESDDARDFYKDYSVGATNGLILVVDSRMKIEDVVGLPSNELDCVKLVIWYNGLDNKSNVSTTSDEIVTDTIKKAVNEAYKRVENKQAILFAHVNSNFDLFEHIDFI
jgi:hypothetical protein